MNGRRMKSATATFVRERLVRPLLPQAVTTNINRNDRIGALCRAWGHVFTNQIEGGYYELGIYRGDTFRASIRAYAVFEQWLRDEQCSPEPWRRQAAASYAVYHHHYYAFDTFAGLPEHAEGNRTFPPGAYSCSLEEFARLNRAAGIMEGPRVRYFAGLFAEVSRTRQEELRALQPVAIANIDCDLYVSARDALELVAPKLVQGSVLLFDDWNAFCARREAGERRALQEFLQEHPGLSVEPWFSYHFSGQAFLVHRQLMGA